MSARPALLAVIALLTSCDPPAPVVEPIFTGCDPLDEARCALPFPSAYFEREDATTASGMRVRFWDGSDCPTYSPGVGESQSPAFDQDVDGEESLDPCTNSLPVNIDDVAVKPHFFNRLDGFSIATPILAFFDDVSLDGVLTHQTLADYTRDDVKTVILDEAGNRVPHFVELDMTAEDPGERLLILRPVEALKFGTRYTVGIRGLTTNAGAPVAVSPAFAALRDGVPTQSWDVESRRERFDTQLFPALQASGFVRSEVQLAWDFTTGSRDGVVGDAERIRDDMPAHLPSTGVDFTITSVEEADCAVPGTHIGRTVYADLHVPYYTTADKPGVFLARDAGGHPAYRGMTDSEVMVRIPCSVLADPGPVRTIQYGHGLLGDKSEARTGWLADFLDSNKMIAFAMDWKGMATSDATDITFMLVSDISAFGILPERSVQGINEWVLAARAMKGTLGDDPALMVGDTRLVDPNDIVYYGISQGGILGGAYMGLTTEVTRGVFGVSGANYSYMLSRSQDFDPFFLVFMAKYPDHRDVTMGIALFQQLWDPAESSGWLSSMNGADLQPGMAAKQILLQPALDDAQVTPLTAHVQARAYGAKTISAQTRPIFGIEEASAPFVGSGITEYAYRDVPAAPDTNVPTDSEIDPHECPRRQPEAQAQIVHFFETGEIKSFCDGPCVFDSAATCR